MAIISGNVSSDTGTAVKFKAEYETITVKASAAIEASGPGFGVSNTFAHTQLLNSGTIVGRGLAVSFSGAADDAWIVNTASGAIMGAAGIDARGDALKVSNAGVIIGTQLQGIFASGLRAEITNKSAGEISGERVGVEAAGANFRLSNFGDVTSSGVALQATGSAAYVDNGASGSLAGNAYGVIGGTALRLVNHGSIAAASDTAILANGAQSKISNYGSVDGLKIGVQLSGAGAYAYNEGVIEGGTAGVKVTVGTGNTTILVNRGTIDSAGTAVQASGTGVVQLYNYSGGVLGEDVILNSAGDFVRNGGEIRGDAKLGGGADIFNGRGGSVSGSVLGGLGNDRLTAGNGDTVMGEAGNDVLIGAGQNDFLVGGSGADQLRGGYGADFFVFNAVEESTVATSGQDKIFGFDSYAGDRIDVSGIDASAAEAGDQDFIFIDGSAFSAMPHANFEGELRAQAVSGGVQVQGDVNADGIADFQLFIANYPYIHSSDFIL